MRFHAPLCILPPCASPLPVSGPHQRPEVIPGQPSQPVCVILHASGPAARSFPLASPVLPMRTAIALFPLRQALCAPVRFDPTSRPRGSPLPRHMPPLWRSGATNGHHAQPEVGPSSALFAGPVSAGRAQAHSTALPLRVAPRQAAPIKRRGRKAGASLPPVSAAVPRITDLVSGCT